MKRTSNRSLIGAAAALAVALVAGTAWAQNGDPGTSPPGAAEKSQPIERFKAAGKEAPLTVIPPRLAGKPVAQVGEVMALMLERAGMTELETSATAFTPPENADLATTARAFAEFIRMSPPSTEYALFTDFMGSPKTGPTEVRGVVVNRQGEIVWQDRQAKGDADFDRVAPREPMQCCLLIVGRLRPILDLGDPTSADAPQGKMAQRLRRRSGIPDQAEIDAIKQRGEAFKIAAAGASLLVYPAHAGEQYDPDSAARITAMLNERELIKATASEHGPQLKIDADMSQQKVLWSMAQGLSDYVKENPPEADYVLFADYVMGEDFVGGVNFAVCNRQGELVIVDFQNNHWPDFNAIDPRTREDCDRLVVKRLEGYCK